MTWPEKTIGDYFEVKHGFAFKGQFFDTEGDYVVVTPGNFHEGGGFRTRGDKEKFYTQLPPTDYVLERGDLILAMTEQAEGLLGSSALVPESGRYLHNQRIGLITNLDESALDRRFLYYLFNTRDVRMQIRATATGAKVKHTAPERIRSVVSRLPPLPIQRRVADILSNYDELIDNNNRRMALIEESVHLMYREWFVYLRFPGCDRVEIVGGIPDGWAATTLEALVSQERVGVDPAEVDIGTPYVGLEHIPRRCISLQEWGCASDVQSSKFRFQTRDILFGKIRPYFHKVALAPVDGICSSDTIILRCRDAADFPIVLCVASSKPFVDHAWQTAKIGSKMPRANWDVLKEYPILRPPAHLHSQFGAVVEGSVAQIFNLIHANRRIREARDLLQPRLMDGSIAV